MNDPMDQLPGSDRYDYVEIEGPSEIPMDGEWTRSHWLQELIAAPCLDCRANVFLRWLGHDVPPEDQTGWHITIAHDDGCPTYLRDHR